MRREFNVLALIKDEERYVYVYDDESRETLLQFLKDQAADPVLALNWFDAAVLTRKAHEQAPSAPAAEPDALTARGLTPPDWPAP